MCLGRMPLLLGLLTFIHALMLMSCQFSVDAAVVMLLLVHRLTSCIYANQTVSLALHVMPPQAPLCTIAYTPTFTPEGKMQMRTK